ncbi:endonuclease domain-containing protein [Micromonospora sp. NPDC049497]|uniref:endonuclease domain-containing protein n=1 Tax=Micromonospora sp. NPDC049497 TaxID=3364273 RepID=UPI0037872E2D
MTRRTACQVLPEWTLEQACSSGSLLRVLPEVFVDPRLLEAPPPSTDRVPLIGRLAPDAAHRAALAWADGRAVLSHVSALQVWGLLGRSAGAPLHLSAPAAAGIRSQPGVLVHRYHNLLLEPPCVVERRGLPVTRLERTLVDSWPQLASADRRAPVIRAVNDRLTTPERLAGALAVAPRLTGRAELRTLLTRLAEGCRSPLEIWGHERVFTGPGMPAFRRQARVRVGRRTMYLDLFAERERVDIELDGATTHGDPRQREIDLRRDALLATAGILTVRFAHRRLVHEPDEVRRETRAILASRR